MYEHLSWKQLASDEKREIGIAFIGKALYDSNASDQLDSLRNSSHHDSMYFADRMDEIRQEEQAYIPLKVAILADDSILIE